MIDKKKKTVKLDFYVHQSFDTDQYYVAKCLSEVDPIYKAQYVRVPCELHIPLPEKKVCIGEQQLEEAIRLYHRNNCPSALDDLKRNLGF